MNLLRTDREGLPVRLSAQQDIFDAAAIVFSVDGTGFVELGGGGPKNFIQQTGNPFALQDIGGWSDMETVKIYMRLAKEAPKEAMGRMRFPQ